MFATALVAAKVVFAARKRPLQILVLDGRFKELSGALISEVIDVFGERLFICNPAQIVLKDAPTELCCNLFDVLLVDAVRFNEPVPARFGRIERP
jgi:hypothetical protein